MTKPYKFKAGDKVKCLRKDNAGSKYTPGNVYTVRNTEGPLTIRIDGPDLGAYGWVAVSDYFELYIETPVDAAKSAVAEAEAKLKEATDRLADELKKAEEAQRPAYQDLKTFDILELNDFDGDTEYRIVVKTGKLILMVALGGGIATQCNNDEQSFQNLVRINKYTKSTKTLKDIL